MPYRKIAPAPAPLTIELKSAPIVEAPKSRDVFDELEKVEVDPKVLEEARSSNRAWGIVGVTLGSGMIAFSIAMDVAMWNSGHMSSRSTFIPGIGFVLVAYGIRRWRRRDIEY